MIVVKTNVYRQGLDARYRVKTAVIKDLRKQEVEDET